MTMATDEVVPGDGSPTPEEVPELNSSTAGGAVAATSARVAAEGPASSSGSAVGAPTSPAWVVVNDNIVEESVREPKVILGHREMSSSPMPWV
jgi:hypothetical protein